jgi:hypothetical protein
MDKVRIKHGVKPYGGRVVAVAGRHTYPNGREVVRVIPPGDRRGGWMHSQVREYNANEVESLSVTKESLCQLMTVEEAVALLV